MLYKVLQATDNDVRGLMFKSEPPSVGASLTIGKGVEFKPTKVSEVQGLISAYSPNYSVLLQAIGE